MSLPASDGQKAKLDYFVEMLGELAEMAKGEKLEMLAYLIGMAHGEASERARDAAGAAKKGQRKGSADTRPPG